MYKGLGKALPKTAGESLRNRVLPQLILAKPEAPKPELMRTQRGRQIQRWVWRCAGVRALPSA